eukprot:702509-Pleurochrysis_carterae.AAC.2
MPSDGFSPLDAHPYGYGYDSLPHSVISLMTPEYEPPAFGYSSGLCHIPPRKASMGDISVWVVMQCDLFRCT